MESVTTQSLIAIGAGILVIGAVLVFIGEFSKLIELRPESGIN
ncbi:hypothetical protein [Alkalihalobacillus sp. AL-G]|nr:hypothetical protein [Alkalihalobacillus sp. AL-G]